MGGNVKKIQLPYLDQGCPGFVPLHISQNPKLVLEKPQRLREPRKEWSTFSVFSSQVSMLNIVSYWAFYTRWIHKLLTVTWWYTWILGFDKHDKIGFHKSLPKHLQNPQYLVLIESLFLKVHVFPESCSPGHFKMPRENKGH